MSCQLHWRPIRGGHDVGGSQLRDALREEFGLPYRLSYDHVPFLRGLMAAKVDGARELLALIEKHEVIEVYQEC